MVMVENCSRQLSGGAHADVQRGAALHVLDVRQGVLAVKAS